MLEIGLKEVFGLVLSVDSTVVKVSVRLGFGVSDVLRKSKRWSQERNTPPRPLGPRLKPRLESD